MRLLLLPNEPVINQETGARFIQQGSRKAFAHLASTGAISSLCVYPYMERMEAHSTRSGFLEELVNISAEFDPDLIFIQHVSNLPIPIELWPRLQQAPRNPAIIYHEGDAYSRISKRVQSTQRAAMAAAELTFSVGLGPIKDLLIRKGARQVFYAPHSFDSVRFGHVDPVQTEKIHELAMIGNRVKSRRLPVTIFPGARARARAVEALTAEFGNRFALYGSGWSGNPCSKGNLPFEEQERAIQSARITVNWDHFDTLPYYFSDRLPIALAAGVPHVTNWHEGYEEIFRGCPGIYWARSIPELVRLCQWLLSRSDGQLLKEGLGARQWAFDNLEANVVYGRMFELSVEARRRMLARAP